MDEAQLRACAKAGYEAAWVDRAGYDNAVPSPNWADLSQEEQDNYLVFATEFAVQSGEEIPAPTADAGEDDEVVADVLTAEVELDASGSDAGGGDPLYYVWLEAGVAIATGETPTVELDINVHTITLLFANDLGAYDTDTVVITVTAP